MCLSEHEKKLYAGWFACSTPGDTLTMEKVVEVCRNLGWPEEEFPADTIKGWLGKEGPITAPEFISMFEDRPTPEIKEQQAASYPVSLYANGQQDNLLCSCPELSLFVAGDVKGDFLLLEPCHIKNAFCRRAFCAVSDGADRVDCSTLKDLFRTSREYRDMELFDKEEVVGRLGQCAGIEYTMEEFVYFMNE